MLEACAKCMKISSLKQSFFQVFEVKNGGNKTIQEPNVLRISSFIFNDEFASRIRLFNMWYETCPNILYAFSLCLSSHLLCCFLLCVVLITVRNASLPIFIFWFLRNALFSLFFIFCFCSLCAFSPLFSSLFKLENTQQLVDSMQQLISIFSYG